MAENTTTTAGAGTGAGSNSGASLRRSPAAHLTEQMAAGSVTGERAVALREIAFPVQIGLRAAPGSHSAAALEKVLGFSLPARVGELTGDEHRMHVLWISPDEFLAVDVSRQQQPGDADELAAALESLPGQAVDLSANRAVLELSGPAAREVLEKGCHADLHPRAFPPGTAVATSLATVQVLLHRVGGGQHGSYPGSAEHTAAQATFRVLPRASFTEHTVNWLTDAMREFAAEEVA